MEIVTLGKCFLLGMVVVVLVAKRFHLDKQLFMLARLIDKIVNNSLR